MVKVDPFENLIEPYAVSDTFATDLVKIEKLGPCARLTFASRHATSDGRGGTTLEYHVVEKLIVPGDMLVTWGAMLLQRPDLTPEGRASEPGRELH